MPLFRLVARPVSACCGSRILCRRGLWSGPSENKDADWKEQAGYIRSGAQPSMISILEERGLVKDIAGGREGLDWLLTEKPVGAYVGVDPTAPSLHVGHLLPLMALFWMYMYGHPAVTLLGTGTVQIGDPSGRTSARSKQTRDAQRMNQVAMESQLKKLWINVKALGVKHHFPATIGRYRRVLHNDAWLKHISAIELLSTLGSGMRLGSMLARDSVRMRMESGSGMALSEFCYPLFQGYDWWYMYRNRGVQLQLGGSDQYGNICAGMEAIDIMRRLEPEKYDLTDRRMDSYGITTPLLTTASGEKFGKSAGNAVWLDPDMMSSFDLYQYMLSTSDADVERYLLLFTFLPKPDIALAMSAHREDESKRIAQHLLAKELVELAHGAEAAKIAQQTHRNAFGRGSNTLYLQIVRDALKKAKAASSPAIGSEEKALLQYKKHFAAPTRTSATSTTETAAEAAKSDSPANVSTLPLSLVETAKFSHTLYAAGLASSRSDAHRLIKSKGAYVLVPNSGTAGQPLQYQWTHIEENARPQHYLIDYEALVLRAGKSKIKICQVMTDEDFKSKGLSCPGWGEIEDGMDVKGEKAA